ncbi:MAG TPA: BPSS1780 family membrane protein [Usitatibacter sp.]|nr:BPSS1780 family membrane protein [Usitatibacter sp.]
MDDALQVADVPARRGAAWLGEAFSIFREQPLNWIALCVGWAIIWLVLLFVPLVGLVTANLLQPVFFGSFAIAAYKHTEGERVVMGDLFSAFRRSFRPLFNIGFLMMLAQLASVFLMRALGLPSWPSDRDVDLYAYAEMLRDSRWVLLAGLSVTTLASAALWFAPPLIVFHGMPASHAIRWSVYAALSNAGAMIVYGVILMVLMVLAWLPFGLGLFVLLPVLVISTYTSYRDIFDHKPPE